MIYKDLIRNKECNNRSSSVTRECLVCNNLIETVISGSEELLQFKMYRGKKCLYVRDKNLIMILK